ncbi:MAG: hypothetical protein ACREO5_07480, partial [Candidatus Binatia bacterium]
EWGSTIAMDLIRWVFLFFDSLVIWQPVAANPEISMDIPLTLAIMRPAVDRSDGRWSWGPTAVNRRSDL